MAKQSRAEQRTSGQDGNDTAASTTTTMEDHVVAFAEQLGRIVGTVQAKAEGWMERDTLSTQVAGVRDAAADLLERLGGNGAKSSTKKPAAPAAAPRKSAGRSGGAVDAPGKKHRKPTPSDPRASAASGRAPKARAGTAMMKGGRGRGRG